MKYKIITLNDEDFSRLPYERVSTSVGITDRMLGISYIRDTGDVDEDVDTLIHEINEMENKVSPYGWSHEDKYGVRYKSWFQKTFIPESKSSIGSILGTGLGVALAPFTGGTSLAFLNPATLGALGGAVGGYQEGGGVGSTLMGGLKGFGVGSLGSGVSSALQGSATGLKGNMGEFLKGVQEPSKIVSGWAGKLTSGLTGAPAAAKTGGGLMGQGGVAAGNALTDTIGGTSQGLSSFSSAANNASNFGAGNLASGFNQAMSSNPSMNLLGASGAVNAALKNMSATPSASPSGLSTSFAEPAKKSGLSSLQKFGIGAALTGIGQTAKTPEIPESRFAQMMEQGGLQPRTAIGQQAMQKASELLAQGYTELSPEYTAEIEKGFKKRFVEEDDALRQSYKNLRPYADLENDSRFKQDLEELHADQREYAQGELIKLKQANLESNKAYQRQDIMNAMGIDEQTFNEYASLANQDLNTIMMQSGIDYGQAQQFKDMFGKLGGQFISSGLGLGSTSQGGININVGKA